MINNRWIIALAGMLVMTTLGSIYSWSIFSQPLVASFGWSSTAVTWTFALATLFLFALQSSMNESIRGTSMRAFKRMGVLLLAVAAVPIFSSCSNEVGYYAQCVQGHLGVLAKRQPIDRVLADPAGTPELKEKLALVLRIRDFASRELLLPDNGSYRCYADLKRPEVVWNVVAAPEFSLRPRQWCFPVAGCVTYRGYYSRDGAQALSESLQREGDDVHLYGVDAYSTLGWFDDPLLSHLLRYDKVLLSEIVFHELFHNTLYLKGASVFNESSANFVGHRAAVEVVH